MTLATGTRLGPYEILAPLGAGGMGEVYRARDQRLGREVAVKVLPDAVTAHPDRLIRFEQEARAVSALNHPGILAVHDVGDHEGLPFMVLELLEGQTLRDALAAGRLPLSKVLDRALQIARALAAAHDKGVVHRDLKPANIFVTRDGRTKILDFGLAKLEGREPSSDEGGDHTDDAATAQLLTDPGKMVGTAGYMSPEQVRGEPVDHRSDIFAFGCVLYEMVTGRRAFQGKTKADTLAAVLHDDPEGLTGAEGALSPGLRTLVSRCLEKNPDERFQSARDLAFALETASVSSEISRPAELALRRRPPRGRARQILWGVGALTVVLAVVVAVLSRSPGVFEPPSVGWTSRQLTSDPGWEREPALSPDGSLVAFSSDRSGNSEIWVIETHGGTPLRLTDDPANDRSPAWFPDGRALLFVSDRGGGQAIWKVPRLGGAAELLLENAESPAVSPDGSRLAFCRRDAHGLMRIAVAPLADLSRAVVLTSDQDGLWNHEDPAWSPDGRTLSYADARDLWLVPSTGGKARQLTNEGATDSHPAWSPDGRWIYFSSMRGGSSALWRIAAKGGAQERITLGTGPEAEPNLGPSGQRIAYSTLLVNPDVVILDLETGASTRIPGLREEHEPTFSPDGRRLVFSSDRSGSYDLWVQRLEGGRLEGEPVRLTEQPGNENVPAFSPDGRWIAYGRVLEGQRDIWIVPSTGGQPTRFTEDAAVDVEPAWSPDGSRIAFVSNRSGGYHLWAAPVSDAKPAGEAVPLTSGDWTDRFPTWSPDGDSMAFLRDIGEITEVWVLPTLGGGAPRQITHGAKACFLRWERGRGTLLVAGKWGAPAVSLRRVSTSGDVLPLARAVVLGETEIQGEFVGAFDVSGDGRYLAFVKHEIRGDVWLLEPGGGSGSTRR
jgi:eukaryotic-like serine/threonine-protein kinase